VRRVAGAVSYAFAMPGDTAARASPSAKLPRWELLRALERVAPRFTLGDALLQLPDYAGTADELRAAIVECCAPGRRLDGAERRARRERRAGRVRGVRLPD
jgi:hypothetical protein